MSSRYGQWTLGDTGACNECGLVAWNTDIHDAFHNRTVDSAEPMQAPHYPEPEKWASGESESLENWTAARAVALAENRALLAEAKALLADRDEAYETGYRDGLLSMFEPTDKGPFPRKVTLPDGTQATRHASLGATIEWAGIQRARKAVADMKNASGYPQSVFDHIKDDALDCIDALIEPQSPSGGDGIEKFIGVTPEQAEPPVGTPVWWEGRWWIRPRDETWYRPTTSPESDADHRPHWDDMPGAVPGLPS